MSQSVVTSEDQLCIAEDRVTDVLELEPIGVRRSDLDPFDPSRVAELDAWRLAVPRVVEEEGALASEQLELVSVLDKWIAPMDEEKPTSEREATRVE